MPIIKSAKKKVKQDQRRYAQNLRTKRNLRTAGKEFEVKPTFDTFRAVQSAIDTAVKKNILTKQAASRRLSRLAAIAKEKGVKVVKITKTGAKPTTKPAAKTAAKPVTKAAKKPVAKKPATKK
jgi:ribosomal protein S20